jgi:hypothetical protein
MSVHPHTPIGQDGHEPHHRVAGSGGGGRASSADARREIDPSSQMFLQRGVTDISFGCEDDELRARLPRGDVFIRAEG